MVNNTNKNSRIKDERAAWSAAPSSFILRRLTSSLAESYDMIERYFPNNAEVSGFMESLEDMVAYFNNYHE